MEELLSKNALTAIAIFIGVIAYIPYILSILKGKTRPHIFSWIIWGVLTGIAFFAQLADGAGAGAWVTGFTAILCIFVALLALKHGEKEITESDKITFIIALSVIPVWIVTSNPLWSIIIITIIDALGFYPTFRKSYYKPYEEMVFVYLMSGLKFAIAMFALENITLTTTLYPLSLVIMNGGFVAMVMVRRFYCRRKADH